MRTDPSRSSNQPTLTEEDLQNINQLIIAQPDITTNKIIEKQGLSVNNETVRKAVIGLGYIYEKSPFMRFMRQNESVFDVVAAKETWSEMITQCEADKLVFLDESSVNTDLNCRYGRAIDGERSVDRTSLNTPANTTILLSVKTQW